MLDNKIIAIFAIVLIVSIIILTFLFYENFRDVYSHHFNNNAQTSSNERNEPVVPAGTEIPLVTPQRDPLPISNSSEGGQISLGTIGSTNAPGAPANKNQPNENNNNQAAPPTISMDPASWKTYTNKKYNYSFKYPQEFDYGPCDKTSPCRFGQVHEKDGGDSAWLNGALSNQGWPFIIITHYDNESYTLPKNVKFFDWLTQKMGWTKDNAPKDFNLSIPTTKGDPKKAMKVTVPQTPQAYARDEIYYEENSKIFEIQLMAPNYEAAQKFYATWLGTFIIN